MFYEQRCYQVKTCPTIEDLADKLTRSTWTTCTAFRYHNLLFVNDSTGDNGAQEYAVIRGAGDLWFRGHDIESLTVSWMTPDEIVEYVPKLEAIEIGSEFWHRPASIAIHHTPAYCHRCA